MNDDLSFYMRTIGLSEEQLARALLEEIEKESRRFRIYDLRNNELTTEELHARVYAWYEADSERRRPVLELESMRQRERRKRRDSFLKRSQAQRRGRA